MGTRSCPQAPRPSHSPSESADCLEEDTEASLPQLITRASTVVWWDKPTRTSSTWRTPPEITWHCHTSLNPAQLHRHVRESLHADLTFLNYLKCHIIKSRTRLNKK